MKNDHTPSVNALYWALLLLVTIAGHSAANLALQSAGAGWTNRALLILLPCLALWAVFALEARDRSTTKAWYWLALLPLQMAASIVCATLAFGSGAARLAFYLGPIVVLRLMAQLERGNASLEIANHLLSRPGELARPAGDARHWQVAAIVALCAAAGGDFIVLDIGGGKWMSLGVVAALAALSWLLIRRIDSAPLLRFWRIAGFTRVVGVVLADLLLAAP